MKPVAGVPVWRVVVKSSDKAGPRASVVLAGALGVPVGATRAVLKGGGFVVPLNQARDEAFRLAEELRAAGVMADPQEVQNPTVMPCSIHPRLANDGRCGRCDVWICVLDRAEAGGKLLCPDCWSAARRKRRFMVLRVGVLLSVLAGVSSWALATRTDRAERRDWNRTLKVAFVVVASSDVDAEDVEAIEGAARAMEGLMEAEFERYGGELVPFDIEVLPTHPPQVLRPQLLADDLFSRGMFAFEMWQFMNAIHGNLGREPGEFDARIYLIATPPRGDLPRIFEGIAAQGGDYGMVEIELGSDTVILAVITATHEMLHTIGATDKYDLSTGEANFPSGYVDPENRYPQNFMEIMAHDIPIAPGRSRLPSAVRDVQVGEQTAREIGWLEEVRINASQTR